MILSDSDTQILGTPLCDILRALLGCLLQAEIMASVLLQQDSGLLESSENIQKHTRMYPASHTRVQACRHTAHKRRQSLVWPEEDSSALCFWLLRPLAALAPTAQNTGPSGTWRGFKHPLTAAQHLQRPLGQLIVVRRGLGYLSTIPRFSECYFCMKLDHRKAIYSNRNSMAPFSE